MSLALATLLYEWRRYMAAVVALAFSGMMVLVMLGLFTGIIHSDFATTERSRADIFILPPKVASMVNANVSLPKRVQPLIFLNPHVTEVRSLEETFGSWVNRPGPGGHQVQKFIQLWGVDPQPGAVTLPFDYTEETRIALMEPGAVAVDASALGTLGVKLGDTASINGHAVRVRAILHNYQSIESPALAASRDTVRGVSRSGGGNGAETGPLMVRIDNPALAETISAELNASSHGAYRAWTKAEFNRANENAVMSQQIVGVMLSEASLIGLIASAVGLASGAVLALVLTWVINKAFFGWSIDLAYPWGELAFLPLWMIAASLAAGLLPALKAAKMSPAAALRME